MTDIFNELTREDDLIDPKLHIDNLKSIEPLIGWRLRMQQFHGHFLKCIYFALRNWKLVTIQLLLPALMTATGAIIITVAARPQGEIDLDLSIRYRVPLLKRTIFDISI